ncbi:MAG: aldo/keto reductase, partial [Ahrensia sp.]
QMAIAWCLRDERVTTALIGASKPSQIEDCAGAINNLDFSDDELAKIEGIADDMGISLWDQSSEGV